MQYNIYVQTVIISPNKTEKGKKKKELANLKMGQLRLSSLRNKKKTEQSFRDSWDVIKQMNTHITGVPEEEIQRGQKEYLKKSWPKTSQIW